MCFSAPASFASGVAVGIVGVATLARVRHPREILLGSLPLLFAVHQLSEGVVWLRVDGRVPPAVGHCFAWGYVIFAQALLPLYCPLCLWLVEPTRTRRRLLLALTVVGAAVTAFALATLARSSFQVVVVRHSIEYHDPLIGPWWFAALYTFTTCTPPFLSSYRWMIAFGVLILVGLLLAALYKALAFTSVWCAFAALVSGLIYLHFRRLRLLAPGD